LCLYGNDIDETTTPVEAALTWLIGLLLTSWFIDLLLCKYQILSLLGFLQELASRLSDLILYSLEALVFPLTQ